MATQARGRRPSPPEKPETPVYPEPFVYPEPEVRRWPHPIDRGTQEELSLPAALHFIHCSLSYQNQLLSEIRALLEACAGESACPEGK